MEPIQIRKYYPFEGNKNLDYIHEDYIFPLEEIQGNGKKKLTYEGEIFMSFIKRNLFKEDGY